MEANIHAFIPLYINDWMIVSNRGTKQCFSVQEKYKYLVWIPCFLGAAGCEPTPETSIDTG